MPETTFTTILTYVLLFVVMMLPGFLLSKSGKFSDAAVPTISHILMSVAMPSLVLTKLSELDLASISPLCVAVSALLPIILEFALYGISRIIISNKSNENCCRPARFCAIFSNCGFLGIPLAHAVWPEHPVVVFYISIFNCISTFQLLTLGTYILSGDKRHICLKKIIASPILWSIIAGIILSYFGTSHNFSLILTYTTHLSQLTMPLSMLVLGYELSKIKISRYIKSAELYKSIFLKLILSPALTVLLLYIIQLSGLSIPRELALAMLTCTAISTAASASSMSSVYGTDCEFAATITVATTVLSVITLPLMYLVFEKIF